MQGAHYSVSDLKMSKIHTNPSKTALVALIYFRTYKSEVRNKSTLPMQGTCYRKRSENVKNLHYANPHYSILDLHSDQC